MTLFFLAEIEGSDVGDSTSFGVYESCSFSCCECAMTLRGLGKLLKKHANHSRPHMKGGVCIPS